MDNCNNQLLSMKHAAQSEVWNYRTNVFFNLFPEN